MKSYFLSDVEKPDQLHAALSKALPGQTEPWLLLDETRDPVAYFNVTDGTQVQADISGRHYHSDAKIIAVLEQIRSEVGGAVEADD